MTEDEAQKLLDLYADGLLEAEQAREVEAVLAESPQLQSEFRAIEEKSMVLPLPKGDSGVLSEDLLTEALAPLRPSRSARMKLSDAMVEVHRHAEHVANTLPEEGWRMFRLLFSFAALAVAVTLTQFFPVQHRSENSVLFQYVTVGIFGIGMLLVLGGRVLAKAEYAVLGAVQHREVKASRLEVLLLEVFGILSVLTSAILYAYQFWV